MSHFDIHSELLIRVGISSTALPAGLSLDPGRSFRYTDVITPVQTDLSADIDDLVQITGVLRVAAPLLDDLMTAFGWPHCAQLNRDGKVNLRAWGSMKSYVERWVKDNDVPFQY